MDKLEVLNCYPGAGGNRRLWEDVHVTAVEINPKIAEVYSYHFPDDRVIVGDAHEYLIKHYDEYDYIWTSPECPTHSRARFWRWSKGNPVYPDMSLYQEIILLQTHFKGKYTAENVIPYYDPLIPGKQIGRHTFWTNFPLGNFDIDESFHADENRKLAEEYGFEIEGEIRKKVIRNMVHPEIGKYILDCARGIIQKSNTKQMNLYESNGGIS